MEEHAGRHHAQRRATHPRDGRDRHACLASAGREDDDASASCDLPSRKRRALVAAEGWRHHRTDDAIVGGFVERHGHGVPGTHGFDLAERSRERAQVAIATVQQKRIEDILGAGARLGRDDDGTSIEAKPDHAVSSDVDGASCVSSLAISSSLGDAATPQR